jgi:hypothetical protein
VNVDGLNPKSGFIGEVTVTLPVNPLMAITDTVTGAV